MSSSLPLGILLNIASNIVFDKPLREVCYNDIYDIFSSNDDDTDDKPSHSEQMRLKHRPTVSERNERMRRKYRPTLKERVEDRKKSENQYY